MGRLAIGLLLAVAVLIGGAGCQAPRPAATAEASGETGDVRQVGFCDKGADVPATGALGWLDEHPGLMCLGVGLVDRHYRGDG